MIRRTEWGEGSTIEVSEGERAQLVQEITRLRGEIFPGAVRIVDEYLQSEPFPLAERVTPHLDDFQRLWVTRAVLRLLQMMDGLQSPIQNSQILSFLENNGLLSEERVPLATRLEYNNPRNWSRPQVQKPEEVTRDRLLPSITPRPFFLGDREIIHTMQAERWFGRAKALDLLRLFRQWEFFVEDISLQPTGYLLNKNPETWGRLLR